MEVPKPLLVIHRKEQKCSNRTKEITKNYIEISRNEGGPYGTLALGGELYKLYIVPLAH